MSDDSDILSHFTPLDELIQVVYQGSARFVILSSVDDAAWTLHVGLTGNEGRWWRGRWTDKDVRNTVGQKVSSILLESFVEKMANAFVQGNVTVGDWSPTRGAEIQLILGTTAKTPIRIPLNELSSEDAAAYAIKVFTEAKEKVRDLPKAGSGKKRKADLEEAEEKIEALKAELEKTKRRQGAIMTEPSKLLPKSNNGSSAPSRPKGASLANPTKKARKYQALEFESDEE
ncbi:hypothetical protein GSI_03838 [Ganoderma sinense ZZ0214-1]|uniref:Uncharacterized protein n=1 Tax=Ganoderma sinense ZZ0214-1 TaxID=1077348 RepID=A0A2G8SK54_9APHY|nr:hypothetical protein GSI_03838 [Ganoderma sinense ZZ0214-1]